MTDDITFLMGLGVGGKQTARHIIYFLFYSMTQNITRCIHSPEAERNPENE